MKNLTKISLTLCTFLIILSGCAKNNATESKETIKGTTAASQSSTEKTSSKSGEYTKITPKEAKERMDKNTKAIILDVRTQSEFEEKHIEGAVLIPNETIDVKNGKLKELPDLDAEILVYCRSGNRSAQAAKKLIEIGYTNVFDFGGINDWPYDVVK